MIVKREVETNIDIANAVDIYTDVESNLMSILTSEYEGKCFRRCYVRKVLRLLQYSECLIAQEGERCYGRISVRFEVEAVVYYNGEIVNGCVVKNKDRNGIIIASSPIAKVFLNAHPLLATVAVGQTISVRVGSAEYQHGQMSVNVNAYPLLFVKEYPLYEISVDSLSAREYASLSDPLERLDAAIAAANETKRINTKGWEFFEKLLYAYRTDQTAPSNAVLVDLATALRTNKGLAGVYTRDHRIRPNTPGMYKYARGTIDDPNAIRQLTSPLDSFVAVIEETITYLDSIRELLTIYNSEKMMTDHKNIWIIFMKNKIG